MLHSSGKLVLSDIYSKTSLRFTDSLVSGSTVHDFCCFGQRVSSSKPPSGSLWSKQGLLDFLAETGYDVLLEEDHTPALLTFAAERFGSGCKDLGYTLVIAGKRI